MDKLFSRWSVLQSIIDPDLPSGGISAVSGGGGGGGGGERVSTPGPAMGSHGDVTSPYESAPWQPTQNTVEEVVAADRRAEKIKPTTETYGCQSSPWSNLRN